MKRTTRKQKRLPTVEVPRVRCPKCGETDDLKITGCPTRNGVRYQYHVCCKCAARFKVKYV